MRYSFLTYLFRRYPLEYSFQMAAEYGFDGVEIWGARPHAYVFDMDLHAISNIQLWKKKYGIEISMYTPELLAYPYNLVSACEKERKETIDYLLAALDVTERIGAKRMLVTLPHPGFLIELEQAWEWAVIGLHKICERAGKLGVKVLLETLSPSESNLLTTADDARRMLRDVGNNSLCGMLDIIPPVIANEPFSVYLVPDDLRLDYVHICNSDGKTEFHAAFNEGILPMRSIFKILERCKFNGWCSLELLAPYFKDPELYLANSIEMMKEYS